MIIIVFYTLYHINMAKTFDSKIQELEKEKSELDLTFLQLKKQEYEDKMYEILDNQNDEINEANAISELSKVKSYRYMIKETEQKIQNNSQYLKDIDRKIVLYKERRERVKSIPLYKDTEEWIANIFQGDEVYQYAKETNNENLINNLMNRSLTPEEYTNILKKEYPKYLENKHNETEKMYRELFGPLLKKNAKKGESQPAPKTVIILPEWLSKQLNKDLKNNKDIRAQEIEDFLKKELKKNSWEIKISHIKNKFWEKSDLVIQYLEGLIKDYPEFKIIDNPKNSKEGKWKSQTKNEKLQSLISSEEIEEQKNERLRKNNLLVKLEGIWTVSSLRSRISWYLDLFEELDCDFADRVSFEPLLYNVIKTYNNIELEKEIIKTLNLLIQWNLRIEKTWLYKYNVFRFNRDNRRMLAYPNWEIFTVCPHEEYERIINTQPPIDKFE